MAAMNTLVRRLAALVLAALPVLLAACNGAVSTGTTAATSSAVPTVTTLVPADTAELPDRGYYLGFLPVPPAGETFPEAYSLAAQVGDFVPVWGRPTPFYGLAADLAGDWGTTFVDGYTRDNGLFPVVSLSFIGPEMALAAPPGMTGTTLADPAWRDTWQQAALDVVEAARPRYLCLGNEVNRWYERYGNASGDPDAFANFVSLYEQTYDAVKELSPDTQVFCTFARELVSENRPADMSVIALFDAARLDLLMLTSYPHAVQGVNAAADIPDDYYASVSSLLPDTPFGFTEVAWPSLEAFGGEQEQAAFLEQLTGRLTRDRGVPLRFLGWPWLTDLDETDAIGLVRRDGTPKPALNVWTGLAYFGAFHGRDASIPAGAVKMMPATDEYPPILHSDEWEDPVPLPYPVNTPGGEDSSFILPDGSTLFVFFTPDVSVPVEKQVIDGVTGIYEYRLQPDGTWGPPVRVFLNDDLAMDGCEFVQDDIMWFCSARAGYTGLHWFTAEYVNGIWRNWQLVTEFPDDFEIGELHFSRDWRELYYHSSRPGGLGNYDIWMTRNVDGVWQEPVNVTAVNSPDSDGWPWLSADGSELWFTRFYQGSPAIFRSKRVNGEWQEPELIVSQFAGECTLDDAGNLYFTHHYYRDAVMLEADIYVCRKKD
jgi:hypothetical protein